MSFSSCESVRVFVSTEFKTLVCSISAWGRSAAVGLIAGSPCLQLSPLPLQQRRCPQSSGSRLCATVASLQLWLLGCMNANGRRWHTVDDTRGIIRSGTSALRTETTSRGPKQTAGGGSSHIKLGRGLLECFKTRGAWCFRRAKLRSVRVRQLLCLLLRQCKWRKSESGYL